MRSTENMLGEEIIRKNQLIKRAHRRIRHLEWRIRKMKKAEEAITKLGNLHLSAATKIWIYVFINKITNIWTH